MSLSITVLSQVSVMFVLMLVGVIAYKFKLINTEGSNQMTGLLLYIVSPLVVINAFQTPFEPRLAKNLLIAFALGIASHLIGMAIAYLFIRTKNNTERAPIERFSIIYSNCGFMALPLVQALFGNEGVFYASAYMTIFNLLSWTHGYMTLSGKTDKQAVKKALFSPVVISVAIGVILFFAQIKLPSVLASSVAFVASLNTPVAMIVTGVSLAQSNILKAFKTLRCYYVILLMNLVVPLVAMLIYLFLPVEQNLILVNLVSTACPCAVTTLLFSTRFGRDVPYATSLLTLANVSCIITIPFIVFLYQLLQNLL